MVKEFSQLITPVKSRLLAKFMFILMVVLLNGCQVTTEPGAAQQPEMAKIKFSLEDIHADGLRGPPDGLVSVAYEFCVPTDDAIYQEVQQIDPSLRVYAHSPGRIGCTGNQSLAIGETSQTRWREVLLELSSLAYVDEIRECFFE